MKDELLFLLKTLCSPRRFLSVLRDAKMNEGQYWNTGAYWDNYAQTWTSEGKGGGHDFIGGEWGTGEIFLGMLEKFGAGKGCALEIGSGGGRITIKAADIFKQVHAADVSPEMIARCREYVNRQNVEYHSIDGFTLSGFADESQDMVFSHDVFVHFSSMQLYPYFKEIKRVLKPGGVGLISFYNYIDSFDLFKKQALRYWEARRFPPHMRIHYVTEEMVRKMLDDIGLNVIEVNTENFIIFAFGK